MVERILAVTIVYLFVFEGFTYAYLDPGTGSYMAQILIASLLGVGYAFRSRLTWVKEAVKNLLSRQNKKTKTRKN